MSPVALGLDLLLVVLLLAALAVGVRLNARLKALRDGQSNFIQAVTDLDQAAARAEAGLASLRAASEEAHDSLLARIETARTLCAKLEDATLQAAKIAAPASTPEAQRTGSGSLARLAASLEAARSEPPRSTPPVKAPSNPRRSRAVADDDLFEGEPTRSPGESTQGSLGSVRSRWPKGDVA